MPTAAVHCKASIPDGMGHIYRQINLANELKKKDWEVSFYIPNFQPAIDLITQAGFPFIIKDSNYPISRYFKKFFDFFIFDIQNTTESLISSVKNNAHWVASFEDLGTGRNHVDLLIDSNLSTSEARNLPSSTDGLFGLDYSVLHPDFAIYHTHSRYFSTSLQSVLITMGATDPKKLTVSLTNFLLQENNEMELTVLVGHNKAIVSELNGLSSQFKTLNILSPVSNLAQILWKHDAVICSGGVTLHEAIAVGTPAFVVNQVEHQQIKAQFVEKLGAAINLGIGTLYDEERLRNALSLSRPMLESMSQKGKQLIDGRGIFRVVDAMNKLIKI
ncbi:MAG: hypothetical protein HN474_03935 [Nitrospina sp.]|nr:hypothetical protein [Nitrospina sp.]